MTWSGAILVCKTILVEMMGLDDDDSQVALRGQRLLRFTFHVGGVFTHQCTHGV